MNCAFCQTPLPESSRFCMTCGADLSDPAVSTRTRAVVKELFEAITVAVEGRYRVTDMLGRGGMGAVFLADDLRLGRAVAIKVLRPELASEGSNVGRFEREARIAAGLDHPNIIPIYAVEEVDGLHYFVMKYIVGKSLDELLTTEPWPVENCRQILWQAACGLGHAHQRGVIHRDVKPSNIMIDEAGRGIITDFGISKALLQDTQYTSTGQIIGTPRYVSPEQAQGNPLDGRSDQYSLAVVGYQMLVGRLPLIGDSAHALMYKHIYEVPPTAQSLRPDIPTQISEALQRAMAKKPADRFATMEDFATAIWPERPVQAGQPTPTIAGFSPLARLIARRRPRHRQLTAAAVVAAGLAVAFLIGRDMESPEGDITESATSPDTFAAPPADVVAPVPAPAAPETVGQRVAPVDTTSADSLPTPSAPDSAVPSAPPARSPPRRARTAPPTPGARARASPETPPPPPAAEVGYLTVNAVPYGTVSIDGVEIGDTPIVRRRLPLGEHVVRITRPGFRPDSAAVTITAGNEVRLRRTLIEAEQ
jgi:serine/threonine-protein kinase